MKYRKPLSTRAQALIGARLGKKKVSLYGGQNRGELNTSINDAIFLPTQARPKVQCESTKARAYAAYSPTRQGILNNFAIITKTYRSTSKGHAKTPNRVFKYVESEATLRIV